MDGLFNEFNRFHLRLPCQPRNPSEMVAFDLTKNGDAEGSGLIINDTVVVWAEQKQVTVMIPVLVAHPDPAPWPLPAVRDDVRDIVDVDSVVRRRFGFYKSVVAAGVGAKVAGLREQNTKVLLLIVPAHLTSSRDAAAHYMRCDRDLFRCRTFPSTPIASLAQSCQRGQNSKNLSNKLINRA
jgi:hypothetical protein